MARREDVAAAKGLADALAGWNPGTAWADLPGDALAWVVSRAWPQQAGLLVVDEPDAAERLARGLRFFLTDPARVELFPADDVRPYDGFSPSPDLPGQRARALYRVGRGDPVILVAPVRAMMARLPSAAERERQTLVLTAGARIDRDALLRHLTSVGYLAVPAVEQPGQVAVRGDVVDVWSLGAPGPRRIDLFDDEVELLRQLDPRTGRTTRKLTRMVLLPAREERIADDTVDRLLAATAPWSGEPRPASLRKRIVEELRAGIRASGLEDWLPALVETVDPLDLLAHLPRVVVHPGSVAASARDLAATATRRWADLDPDERPLVAPEARWVAPDALLPRLADGAVVVHEVGDGETVRRLGFEAVEGWAVRGSDLGPILQRLRKLADEPMAVGLVARDARSADLLEQMFEPHGVGLVGRTGPDDMVPGELSLLVGDLPRGFVGRAAGLALIPSSALFGQRDTEARRRAHVLFDRSVGSLSDLKDGDPVVHRFHGIGRYRGLQRMEVDGSVQDFVKLEYRDGDLLMLPVTSLGELSRYTAAHPDADLKLDRLGGVTWAKRKAGVRDALLEKAQEMLRLQAKRVTAVREAWPEPGPLSRELVARFPYTETPDQARAILDVHDDLSKDAPMDRLICGDVGFGKTEVAIRAAMRVVEGGAQVAVLCPTTVLAFQHAMTFRERFEGLPVRVEMLSRFSSPAEVARTLAGLADGSVDVVVGTHRILGREVRFRRLGMVVIDEEHRFGVSQKDALKRLRASVDILTMSATPIPRTLQLALAGARDMSIMATPPAERLEIRTMVARSTPTRVRDAILLELQRQGQVYVVHNRVETIQAFAEKLRSWVPEARFEVAHGKMEGERIERILVDFLHRRFDVLVCTAIIETGVDMPNVNTMLIDRADQFGLSQLYQLRGRVGRGSVRGNCLLLTPEDLPREAQRRIQVLVDNTRLGSGFSVAAADLEQRGGGNLLGENQSGHIDAVGFETWTELLEEAVRAAQGEVDRERIETVVEVPVPAYLPEAMLPDVPARLGWYRRLGDAINVRNLEIAARELELECGGDLPPEARNLVAILELKLLGRKLGITRIEWHRVKALFELHGASLLSEAHVARLVEDHPKRMSAASRHGVRALTVRFTPPEAEKPLRYLRWVVARMEQVAGTAPRD